MATLWKLVGLYILSAILVNGLFLSFIPHLHYKLPFLFRITPIFNCSFGSRGGTNKRPVPLIAIRLYGIALLILGIMLVNEIIKGYGGL
jgi:hypothetical protein